MSEFLPVCCLVTGFLEELAPGGFEVVFAGVVIIAGKSCREFNGVAAHRHAELFREKTVTFGGDGNDDDAGGGVWALGIFPFSSNADPQVFAFPNNLMVLLCRIVLL